MFLLPFERPASLDYELVVLLIFRREFRRTEIEIGFAQDFGERLAQAAAERAVAKRETARQILPKDMLGQVLDERMIKGLGIAQPRVGLFARGNVPGDELHGGRFPERDG